jgi:hypothetical protein
MSITDEIKNINPDNNDNPHYIDDWSDIEKAAYEDMISRGQALIGKKISKENEFLLDLAAKITIKQMRGEKNNLTPEDIEKLQEENRNVCNQPVHTTPEDIFKDGYITLENGETFKHPIVISQEEEKLKKEKEESESDKISIISITE